jgi:hypothetical protein
MFTKFKFTTYVKYDKIINHLYWISNGTRKNDCLVQDFSKFWNAKLEFHCMLGIESNFEMMCSECEIVVVSGYHCEIIMFDIPSNRLIKSYYKI